VILLVETQSHDSLGKYPI